MNAAAAGGHRGIEVLESLRRFRAADAAQTRRRHASTGLSETDLLAMLHLVRAARDDHLVNARDLAAHLSISAASTTQLIDRLEAAGHVRRDRHPTDRRGVVVSALRTGDADIRSLLAGALPEILDAADELSGADVDTLTRFLDRLTGLIEADRADPPNLDQRRTAG